MKLSGKGKYTAHVECMSEVQGLANLVLPVTASSTWFQLPGVWGRRELEPPFGGSLRILDTCCQTAVVAKNVSADNLNTPRGLRSAPFPQQIHQLLPVQWFGNVVIHAFGQVCLRVALQRIPRQGNDGHIPIDLADVLGRR